MEKTKFKDLYFLIYVYVYIFVQNIRKLYVTNIIFGIFYMISYFSINEY